MKLRTVVVSNSQLQSVACSTEAAIKAALRMKSKDENKRMKCGVALHEAWARHFKGKSAQLVCHKFELAYRDWADEFVEPDDAYAFVNVARILAYWLRENPVERFPFTVTPEHVEVELEEQLTEVGICLCGHKRGGHVNRHGQCSRCGCEKYTRVMMRGVLDLLTMYSGALVPIDHKSTGALTPWWASKFQMDSQMCDYIWLAEQYSGKSIQLCGINAMEVKAIPHSDKKCAEHKVAYAECGVQHVKFQLFGPFMRTKQQIESWKATALELTRRVVAIKQRMGGEAKNLLSMPQEGTFIGRCGFCDCREFCLSGRPMAQFPHMFEEREDAERGDVVT